MKIAVLGSGSHAFEVVEHLENIGAFVKWFATDCEHQKAIKKKVIRVHKRFLGINESTDKSRLSDLFRVVFEQNPDREISEQMQGDNANIFNKLTPMEMDYLKSRFESFEDFDLVINLPNKKDFYRHAGPGGVAAIGEKQLEGVDYGHGAWSFDDSVKEVAIVGEKASHNENLNYLSEWLINGEGTRRAFYITEDGNPLSDMASTQNLKKLEAFEDKRANAFIEKLRDWQKLEDYEKAKIPRPNDPIPTLVFFAGHNITAISKLSDQERIYLTCEIPEWREVQKGRDNAKQALKTVAVDKLIVANGYCYENDIFQQMKKPIRDDAQLDNSSYEPGLIEPDINDNNEFCDLTSDQIKIRVEKVIRHYFMESE